MNTALNYSSVVRSQSTLTAGQMGTDFYAIKFENYEDLLAELERREKNTIRKVVSTDTIQFYVQPELLADTSKIKAICPDAIEESRVFLKIEDEIFPVSLNSFISIRGRIDLQGKGLLELSDQTLKVVLNELIKKVPEVMTVIIDGKVRALFSAGNGGYRPIPIKDLLTTTLNVLGDRIDDLDFEVSYMDYDYMWVKIFFPSMSEKLQGLYGKSDQYIPGIMIKTSDTGFSANDISPIWKTNGTTAVFGESKESIRVVHRGKNASIESIQDDIPNIFVKLRNTIKLIKKQMSIKLSYPQTTLDNACKQLKLGKKDTRLANEHFEIFLYKNPDKEVSAYDITKIFLTMAKNTTDEVKKATMELIAGKAFNLNYERLDAELDD